MKFKVEKCTKSSRGGYVITLRSEDVVDETTGFYSRGIKRFTKGHNNLKIGSTWDVNLDFFRERRDEGVYVDPETGEEREYTNVWIFYKGE